MIRLTSILLSLFLVLPVFADTTIKKCQDAEGKWHYGDHAAFECEQSARVTEMDEEGQKVGEIDAPPTQEELDAKLRAEEQMSEQEESQVVQARLDQRLLVTYDNPDSILVTRDALLAAIDSATEADRILRDRLRDEYNEVQARGNEDDAARLESIKRQIADFDESIKDRLAKREIAREKYDTDYKRYKELIGN